MPAPARPRAADVDEVAVERRGGRHLRADEVRAAAAALAALEVAVRGRGAALARREDVGVHPEAHRAAREAPLEARVEEDAGRGLPPPPAGAPAAEPGTTSAVTRGSTFRPATTAAAARRSSMREFVQEPMKTRSIAMSSIALARAEPHVLERALGRGAVVGVGERGRVGHGAGRRARPCPGSCPTSPGARARRRRRVTCVSYVAPGSEASERQSSSARSQSSPCGACGRPSRKAKVVSSGAIIPARAPPSIDMLQIVIRPSIESARIASPAYSTTCPTPPSTPSLADRAEDHVLRGEAGRQRARRTRAASSSAGAAAASASRARARPRRCRCRTRARRTRRASRCGCRRRRSSSRAG